MGATLDALGGILLRAVPTFLLVVFLNLYLKSVFFKPLEKVLRQRYEATEGTFKLAEEILRQAAANDEKYEAAMRAARGEVYQQQELLHKQLEEREAGALNAARAQADATIRQARTRLDAEVEAARADLGLQSEVLAGQMAESFLQRSAA